MELHFHRPPVRRKSRSLVFVFVITFLSIVYFTDNRLAEPSMPFDNPAHSPRLVIGNLSRNVHIVDLHGETNGNYTCIETKRLLNKTRTTICLHDSRDAVSNQILKEKVWEENLLSKILDFLHRHPRMNFIDVGANLGAYTMFAAALGRDVISIECFRPNLDRIRKAIQIEHLQAHVTLIGNAIYTLSGHYLAMESWPTNVGSQGLLLTSKNQSHANDTYVVQTIEFDDILPVLKARNIEQAVMKVDIQWSEMYICQTGTKVFDSVNIPVVLMEWDISGKERYEARLRYIVAFFLERHYVATEKMCKELKEQDALAFWPSDIFWMKRDLPRAC